eukprot:2864488-Rhodomonas_salina.1
MDQVPDEVQPCVDVPAPLQIHWILRHLDTAGVILPDLGRAKLLESYVTQQRAEVHNLHPALRGSHVLRLTRAERNTTLPPRLPRKGGSIHTHDVASD